MNIIIKKPKQIEKIREASKRLAFVLQEVGKMVKPGISTKELDDYAYKLIKKGGDKPAFLNYTPGDEADSYPATLCTSVNDEIVHCVPRANKILKEGDIISIDIGLIHDGMYSDHAITFPVGKISEKDQALIDNTKKAMEIGIWAAHAGATVGDIGYAIESFVHKRYGIVRELTGHGVGVELHEDPYIPNYGKAGKGQKLIPGMVIAIEPMLNIGGDGITGGDDEYTIKTKDGSRSAHFEHTVLITEGEAEILTKV